MDIFSFVHAARESTRNDVCLNALGCGGSELVTSSTPTCDVVNDQVSYSITDDKRGQRNA